MIREINFKLAFIFAILSVYFGFFAFNTTQMKEYYQISAYFFMMILCSIWLYISLKLTSNFTNIIKYFNNNKCAIFLSILSTIIIFVSCKAELRILADESNLIGTSKSLLTYPRNINTLMSEIEKNDVKIPIRLRMDRRPLLFSFILYIFHCLLGYSYTNSFILNALAAFGCFIAIYYLSNIFYKSKFYGLISIIILTSYPVYILSVTSAGFEIFNLFWSLITFIILINYLKNRTAINSEFLIYTALMLTFTRYEEILTLLIVVFTIWITLYKHEYQNFTKLFTIWPVFCLPVCWLYISTNTPEYFETGSLETAYGVKFLLPNLLKACEFFFNLNIKYGNITLYTIISIASFIILITKQNIFNNKFRQTILSVTLLFYLTHSIARFLFSYSGDLTKNYVNRLGIIYLPLFVFACTYYIKKLIYKYRINPKNILVIIVFILIYNINISGNIYSIRELYFYNFQKISNNIIKRHFPKKDEYILVTNDVFNFFIPYSYNTTGLLYFTKFNEQFNDDLIKLHTWQYILIIDVLFTDEPLIAKQKLDNTYKINYKDNIKLIHSREFFGGNFSIYLFAPQKRLKRL